MTQLEINEKRNANGVFSMSNDICGWYAISRNSIHMITYYKGKFTSSEKDDVNKFYTEKAFAKRLTQLINKGH